MSKKRKGPPLDEDGDRPFRAYRCEAYEECAHWAFDIYAKKGDGLKWFCEECGRFHANDGWFKVTNEWWLNLGPEEFDFAIEFDVEFVSITSAPLDINLYWDRQEWLDDPEVTIAIARAVHLVNTNPKLLTYLFSDRLQLASKTI